MNRRGVLTGGEWPSGARIGLVNGHFADVRTGRYYGPGVSVVVERRRIVAMPGLPGEPNEVPVDYQIDLEGRFVAPGLINSNCHLQRAVPSYLLGTLDLLLPRGHAKRQLLRNMSDCLQRGIVTVRDGVSDDLAPNQALREAVGRGKQAGPRIHQAVAVSMSGSWFTPQGLAPGGDHARRFVFDGPSVDYRDPKSGIVVFSPEATSQEVRDAVDRAVDERSADAIKIVEQRASGSRPKTVMPLPTLRQLDALVDQARRRSMPTIMHLSSVESFRRGVHAGVSVLSHLPIDASLTPRDADSCAAAGCVVEPTATLAYGLCFGSADQVYANHPTMARLADLRRLTEAAMAEEFWLPELSRGVVDGIEKAHRGEWKALGLSGAQADFAYYSPTIVHGGPNLWLLRERGVPIACGNAAGVIPPATPASIGLELMMIDFLLGNGASGRRLSGAEALRMATLVNARALGIDDSFGSIATGKVADLAVLDLDPLSDYRNIGSRVAALFQDGKLVVNACGLQLEPR